MNGGLNFYGRGDGIRTCDPLHPMQVLYQAELHPDDTTILYTTRLNYKYFFWEKTRIVVRNIYMYYIFVRTSINTN